MSTWAPEGTKTIHDLDDAWGVPREGARLRAVRSAAEKLRARFVAGPRAVAVRTLPLTTLPYPTKYAFNAAAVSVAPFVTLTHRCLLVQFTQGGALKTLLFNPTDIAAAEATPYFARLKEILPERLRPLVIKRFPTLEAQLAEHGVSPADVDYVAFDHFHTQDLRTVLGTEDSRIPPRFPRATLLAPEIEWNDWDDLHPMQRAWFVAEGKRGVRTSNVALTRGDLLLGDGVMLLRSPGHTTGNQTLFVNTDAGVWGVSECGTSADNWSPLDSKIRGLAATCRRQDLDVVINSNTPEQAAAQYTSMVMERTIVDRVKRAPAFVQMFPSSEVTPSALAPGLSPTLVHGAVSSGTVSVRARRAAEAARAPAAHARG